MTKEANRDALTMDWGERALRFIGLLLTTPGLELLDTERAEWDRLVAEFHAASNARTDPE